MRFFELSGKLIVLDVSIAYQLVSTDPLLDEDQCKRDAASMRKLGANTIRVYHVDPTGDHDSQINQVWEAPDDVRSHADNVIRTGFA